MKVELEIKKPSFKGIKDKIGNGLKKAGDAVVNAKTPSLKEVGSTINNGQKKLRHKVAELIDSDDAK